MVEQAGALGYFGDARRAAVGTELLERVTASGSLVIPEVREWLKAVAEAFVKSSHGINAYALPGGAFRSFWPTQPTAWRPIIAEFSSQACRARKAWSTCPACRQKTTPHGCGPA
jgi:hypothetical protein